MTLAPGTKVTMRGMTGTVLPDSGTYDRRKLVFVDWPEGKAWSPVAHLTLVPESVQ